MRRVWTLVAAGAAILTIAVMGCSGDDLDKYQVVKLPTSTPTVAGMADPKPTLKAGGGLESIPLPSVLGNGQPTLAEFGWRDCDPCKAMKPILEELAIEYKGRVNVVIVEVYEQRELTSKYRIMGIPTQVLFDEKGIEARRHIGFWAKNDIEATLKAMGVAKE